MAGDVIRTARLTLRRLGRSDAPRITGLINDLDVARWLSSVPHPYTQADAETFLDASKGRKGVWAIVADDLIGVIGIEPERGLGYWIGQTYWGRGYVPEAAQALLIRHFSDCRDPVPSGYHLGNTRSRSVLRGLGFRNTGPGEVMSVTRGKVVPTQRMELTCEDWCWVQAPRIETERLVLQPLTAADAPAIAALGNDLDVSRMLATVPYPFCPDQARTWIGDNHWRGRPGFRWGVWRKKGPLIGMVALGGAPANTAFWLGRAYWGSGFATEAMKAFLGDILPRLALNDVTAGAFVENTASHRVLEKLSFRRTGRGAGRSAARLEPAPVFEYRLTVPKAEGVRR